MPESRSVCTRFSPSHAKRIVNSNKSQMRSNRYSSIRQMITFITEEKNNAVGK